MNDAEAVARTSNHCLAKPRLIQDMKINRPENTIHIQSPNRHSGINS
ncbi:hypothetical protein [Rhizobium sp. ZPR3]|jgi:hypothetical protein|uniref:Uncharacterized protein n=2 Tax=unclassified Rhizobium TaxID=2613769 RepID=A0AAU7S7A8_9HYPH